MGDIDIMVTESFTGSSWISEVQYNTETEQMMVTINGQGHECQGVPRSVYDEFARAPSKGKYFNANIRGKYNHPIFSGD